MKTTIKGRIVEYDEGARAGVKYLTFDIDAEEAKVFFVQARNHGSAVFEDHMGKKFELTHHGSIYKLERD